MSKHTPGPWALRRDPGHFDSLTEITGGICGNTKPFRFTLEVSIGGDTDIHTLEANARLIAAAPDLLEALEQTLQLAIDWEDEARGTWQDEALGFSHNDDPIIKKARAAIAKAKGEV